MTDTTVPPPVAADSAGEDKTVAIIAYITLIGFIAAIVIHSNKKTKLGSFHLRQCLGLVVSFFACGVWAVIPVLGWFTAPFIAFGLFVLGLIGFIAAINGQMKPIPLLGGLYQKWFGTAFE